jgi:hypothetical protein
LKYLYHIVAVFAFVAVLSGTFSKLIIETAFFLQKDYIARVKCENRNRPWLKCDGKCYLKKQLEKDEQQNNQANVFQKFDITWCQASVVKCLLGNTNALTIIAPANQLNYTLTGFAKRLDRPPIV